MTASESKHTFTDQMTQVRGYTSQLSKALPDVMKNFYALGRSATTDGVLDTKTKELIALAIAVATHCDNCIAFHTSAVLKAGATKDEIYEMLGVAVYMGGGPSLMYATHVMEAVEELSASANT